MLASSYRGVCAHASANPRDEDESIVLTPSDILMTASRVAREGRAVALRLPRHRRTAMALAVAGVRVVIDDERGLAHVMPGGV